MPATFTYPGVYIAEMPSGAQAVPAAATSIAMFVGMADMGPFNKPTRVQGLTKFVRLFGQTSKGEMADQVGQFFVNGGGDAYIMRIAKGAVKAAIELESENGTPVLKVTARDEGEAGNMIRVEVDYLTGSPERTFNLTVYRSQLLANGDFSRTDVETHTNLSMNPADARFVNTVVANASALIDAAVMGAPPPPPLGGASISGLFLRPAAANAKIDVVTVLGASEAAFTVSIAGRPTRIARIPAGQTPATVEASIGKAITDAYLPEVVAGVSAAIVAPATGPGRLLQIQSTEGAVVITPASNDCSVKLMLGVGAGGVELDAFSALRPAPTGVFAGLGPAAVAAGVAWLARLTDFAAQNRGDITNVHIKDPGAPADVNAPVIIAGNALTAIGVGAVTAGVGSLAYVGGALDDLVAALNAALVATSPRRWMAQKQGYRLVLRATQTLASDTGIGVAVTTDSAPPPGAGFDIGAPGHTMDGAANVAAYRLGPPVSGGRQSNPVGGLDGIKPQLPEYNAALAKIASEVEIFNMMVLPRADGQSDAERGGIWGAASAFCTDQRAILFVDPLDTWDTVDNADAGANKVKVGVQTRNSVIYWPRVKVPTSKVVDPSGSMAGLYARTDTRFGTWRAPAGIEATLTGVVGLEAQMSDAENGLINPKALNAIRLFPSGITSWGARTMVGADDTGNVDDKYVNVRRMMLFIENSLYRGLRFAVFKNNAEPLWASIRLTAGGFMNGLMLQGAFASDTKQKAYYVLCDANTTTPEDINNGIVNVIVGFAPNKPAEFVQLTVTQIAGQTQV